MDSANIDRRADTMTTKLLEYVQSVRPAVRIAEPMVIPPPDGQTWKIDDLDALVDDFVAVISSMTARIYGRRNSKRRTACIKKAIEQCMDVPDEDAARVQD